MRANVLRTLAIDSYAVTELCQIFDMAQPAMSHHLKILSQAGLVNRRREGTTIFYQRLLPFEDEFLRVLFDALDQEALVPKLRHKVDEVHKQRLANSQSFFATHSQALAQQTALICAPGVYVDAVVQTTLAHLPARHTALEVGPGDGQLLEALSPHFTSAIGVENSPEMLDTTAVSVGDVANIKLIQADFFKLPRIRKYNLVAAAMVVHHIASPAQFFQCAARVLKPKGLLVVAELCAHNFEWVKEACGDVWLGFEPRQLERWAHQAGFHQAQQRFLAQKNGFRVQVNAYQLDKH